MSSSNVLVRLIVTFSIAGAGQSAFAQIPPSTKLDRLAARRMSDQQGRSRVIVQTDDAESALAVNAQMSQIGGRTIRPLGIIHAQVVELPNAALDALARNPRVRRLSLDRAIVAADQRTAATIGATAVRNATGYDGAGIGVAVIDSGVTAWHDDLTAPGGGQRVTQFVDLVNGRTAPYDDLGHGTHVAGIIAGNGFDSAGAQSGIAPGASLIVLKVLDGAGRGHISDVIAALDYVVANQSTLNIRVVNLSMATGVYESYTSDPLALAAKRAVDMGIVVVAAAGNNGRSPSGRDQYAGVGAPGNAPWVLTVGSSSHMGTSDRWDDTMAAFSSRGPTVIDDAAKPDVVAPGVGIESLSDPASAFYSTRAPYLLAGTIPTSYLPYLSLSGTSMSAPVVAGTVALMLQANPSLTPNAVKAVLQYTAQTYAAYDPLTEGAGFLNAKGAVELARFLNPSFTGGYPDSRDWNKQIIWGHFRVSGGRLTDDANAWAPEVTWGAATAFAGQTLEWGVLCQRKRCDEDVNGGEPWRATCLDEACTTGTADPALVTNVVWGLACGGADCPRPWDLLSTSDDGDTVVWGTSDDADTVVWGTADDDDTVVWGTSCGDPACEPVVWGAR